MQLQNKLFIHRLLFIIFFNVCGKLWVLFTKDFQNHQACYITLWIIMRTDLFNINNTVDKIPSNENELKQRKNITDLMTWIECFGHNDVERMFRTQWLENKRNKEVINRCWRTLYQQLNIEEGQCSFGVVSRLVVQEV